ncbi:MAG: 4Fe-4S binding protein [Promethearchaeota archaeon]|jgi:polyferredoxin
MFQASFNIITALPMLVLWICIVSVCTYSIYKSKLARKYRYLLYIISIIIGGLVLGAIPNAVFPIQQILTTISKASPIIQIMPMIITLSLLLASTLLIGRMFCGFACPLGALQEAISNFRVKSSIKKQKEVKFFFKIPQKYSQIIRWAFFVLIIVTTIFVNFALLQYFNPFLGFNLIRAASLLVILFPVISLILTILLGLFIYRPWCQLFCPFGATASILSKFSRFKYRRTDDCTQCELCEKICPTDEAYEDSSKKECYYCGRCVDICPQAAIKFGKKR